MAKILVCGSSGFMGRNIAKFFSNETEYEVIGTNLTSLYFIENAEIYPVDLTYPDQVHNLFQAVHPDIVIQAAAVTSGSKDIVERPYIHTTDNALMNSLVLRACYDFNVKHFVFLSCGVMYQPGEESRGEEDFNEHDIIHPNYFGVGWTKVYIEKMCEFYSRLGKTKHTVIRHSNTYGPYDKYDFDHSHMFGATIRKVMDAKDGDTINVWGTGEETRRDLVYVDDIVRLIDLVIREQEEQYDLINAGFGFHFSVNEVVEAIIEESGKKLNITHDISKPSIPTSLALDFSKARKKYGWYPQVHLREGIRKTINWYKEYYREK